VTARLDNALNRHYELANGYNTGGRSGIISTRYSFR
jgi:outer membrane cobalamin receptor